MIKNTCNDMLPWFPHSAFNQMWWQTFFQTLSSCAACWNKMCISDHSKARMFGRSSYVTSSPATSLSIKASSCESLGVSVHVWTDNDSMIVTAYPKHRRKKQHSHWRVNLNLVNTWGEQHTQEDCDNAPRCLKNVNLARENIEFIHWPFPPSWSMNW